MEDNVCILITEIDTNTFNLLFFFFASFIMASITFESGVWNAPIGFFFFLREI